MGMLGINQSTLWVGINLDFLFPFMNTTRLLLFRRGESTTSNTLPILLAASWHPSDFGAGGGFCSIVLDVITHFTYA